MNAQFGNSITNMCGPDFLILYGAVIAVTLFVCWWLARSCDRTGELPQLPFAEAPDPYEIAYLRGGENEVTRLVVFDLIQCGCLEVVEEPKKWWQSKAEPQLAQVPNHPDWGHLSPIQREAFDSFASPRKASEIFAEVAIPSRIQRYCHVYEERLQSEQLSCPAEVKSAALGFGLIGVAIVLGLGGYKLVAALGQGHFNVLFLLLMGLVASAILIWVCKPPRLSKRGKEYVAGLEQAFSGLKESGTIVSLSASTHDPALLLSVGLFGVGVLAGTPFGYYEEMFHKGAAGNSFVGGCGGGCR